MDPVPGPMAGWSTEAEKERLKMQISHAHQPVHAYTRTRTCMDMNGYVYFAIF